jgi:O-antigen/teichoic acid export membrane protein
MGIIIKQSVRGALWSYLGIAVGYINVGIIMPQFFDTAQIGLVQIFIAVSLIFSQFATLGFTSVINRMFPVFRSALKQNNGFLFLAIATGTVGFILSVAGFFLLKPWIIESNIEKSPLLVDYLYLLMPLVFMRLLFILLDNYNKVLYDAVTGTFWLEFVHKVINLMLIIVFAFGLIDFRQFFFGYILSMSMPVFPVIYVLIRRNEFHLRPDWEFLTRPVKKEVGTVMTYGFVNGLSAILLMNVDKIFVNQFLSLEEVGIFGVCALFATLIKVPYNAISKISVGIIAEAWNRNDVEHIREIYRKSALTQSIIGTLIFVGILINLDNIFEILPPVYNRGRSVLVIYSAGMLWITVIGMASVITETSKYFRFYTIFLLISLVVQFILSFLLIPRFGITGAAVATISTLILNFSLQAVLQKVAFKISGFSKKMVIVPGIGLVSYGAGLLLPQLSLITDVLVRSGLVTIVFTTLVLWSNILPDGNAYIKTIIKKVNGWRN